MLTVVYIILSLLAIILACVICLVIRRGVLNSVHRYTEGRRGYYEPYVLGLLDAPQETVSTQEESGEPGHRMEPVDRLLVQEKASTMQRHMRPYDLRLVEEIMLQQAAELRGQERYYMTLAFEALGSVRREMKRLRSQAWWRRREAAIKLGIMKSEESVPALMKAVNDESEVVRLAAVRALGNMNHPEGVGLLLDVMEDKDEWTGARVIEVVASLGEEPRYVGADRLDRYVGLDRLGATASPRRKMLLIQLCGIMRWVETVPTIIPMLFDEDVETRISAARALGLIGEYTAAVPLRKALDDKRWEVRAQAAESVGLLQDWDAVELLTHCLQDNNWWVRHNAANSLYQLGDEGIPVLQRISSQDGHPAAVLAAQVLAERELGV